MNPLRWIGRKLARYLSEPRLPAHVMTHHPERLAATLQKGDVLLIEGTSRLAGAIRYVTQSTWSHAALFVGDALGASTDGDRNLLIEADINEGVRVMPLSYYATWHTRICRPVGLTRAEIDALIRYAADRIGNQYDMRNVFDLARYLIRTPPVPDRYKRRLLALGSGDPTRAICSSLIAAAFASVRYPVLPDVEIARAKGAAGRDHELEILHIRDSSLYTPRDFDVSPYFRIVKPSLADGFDPHTLSWARADTG
ncbi:MAG TPA: YiiX/YebB-like N1pC/P60 family cysteine hydrolase [Rhodanobacteraceae bacterium]|nr:YiiX/YebB-like N1pC/P60 family cysteine hydrolase [Rhodanobacteraceae bacterium]